MTLRPRLATGLPLRCGINNKLIRPKKQEKCNLFTDSELLETVSKPKPNSDTVFQFGIIST